MKAWLFAFVCLLLLGACREPQPPSITLPTESVPVPPTTLPTATVAVTVAATDVPADAPTPTAAATISSSVEAQSPRPSENEQIVETLYRLQQGETVEAAVERFGVAYDLLLRFNELAPDETPTSGLLRIPTDAEAAALIEQPAARAAQQYVVQPGDSLGELAEQFDVPLADLAAANGLTVFALLYVDQVLTIPGDGPAEDAPAATQYIVRAGDTLREIAEQFGVSQAALIAANGIVDADAIYAGQTLIIPAPDEEQPQE